MVAIDFISRLLAKEPADRLSMPEALVHAWLATPSSQSGESQSQINKLGGDSVWSIESFDPDQERFESDEVEDGERWSRPMTASGTNFESDIPSDGSFSQPMGNLQLTPSRFALPSPPLTAELRDKRQTSPAEEESEVDRPRKSMRVA